MKFGWQTNCGRWWEPDGEVEFDWEHPGIRDFIWLKVEDPITRRVWIDDQLFWDWEEGFVDSLTLMKVGKKPSPKKLGTGLNWRVFPPPVPITGDAYFDVCRESAYVYNGTKWVQMTVQQQMAVSVTRKNILENLRSA